MTRQTRTPAQRAEDDLGVATRRAERLRNDRDRHRAAHVAATAALDEAEKLLTHAQAHPALGPTRPADDEPAVTAP